MPDSATPAVERVIPPALVTKIANPVLRRLLAGPGHRVVSDALMLLHYTGRKSGRRYTLPVAHHDVDGTLTVLTSSGWKANFRGGADAEVTLRGQRRPVHAVLSEDPDDVAGVYTSRITEIGPDKAGRRLGIRLNVDRMPTHAELVDAVHRAGLSVLRFSFR